MKPINNIKKGLIMSLLISLFSGCTGTRPPHLGTIKDSLAECPDKPNCVSSLASDKKHGIAPLNTDDMTKITKVLKGIIELNES